MADAGFPVSEVRSQGLIKPTEISRGPAPTSIILQIPDPDAGGMANFSLKVLWHALLVRMKVMVPLGLVLSALCTGGLWYFSEDKYKAAATLRVIDRQPFVAFPTNDRSQQFAETQVELLRGRFIIGRALESHNLANRPEIAEILHAEDPVKWIGERLKVLRVGKSELYEVSFTTRDPHTAQQVVLAIVDAYIGFHTTEADLQRQRVLEILNEEQTVRERDIELKRERLRDLVRQVGGDNTIVLARGDGPGTHQAIGTLMLVSSLQQRLIESEIEIEVMQAEVAAMREQAGVAAPSAGLEIEASLDQHDQSQKIERQIRLKRDTLRALEKDAPQRQRIAEQLQKLEAELAEWKAELRPHLQIQAAQRAAASRGAALAAAEAQLADRRKAAQALQQRLKEEQSKQVDTGDKSLEIEFAKGELARAEEVFQRISARATELTTESRAPNQVQVVEKAKLPEFPEGPTLVKKLTMVGSAAFIAPFAWAVGLALYRRRVYQPEQLQKETSLKLISEVAVLPERPKLLALAGAKAFERQTLAFEESVNSLRTNLSMNESLRNCRVFVVASAVSGEGKTNLSAQLVASWRHADSGDVVIVDADLRSPGIHSLFEVPRGPGLSEVLRGERTAEEAINKQWAEGLHILPAGQLRPSSANQLLTSARFIELLAELRSRYSRVLIDVPPVLVASETLAVCKAADAVLLCALRDFSRSAQIKQAYERLVAVGANVVAGVLNGVPTRQYYYYYGYDARSH